MYLGEVNVEQDNLSNLIKAAECLRIKGLAVPDEEPVPSKSRDKRHAESNSMGSEPKRRKEENRSNFGSKSIDERRASSESDRRRNRDNKYRDSLDNNSSNVQSQSESKNNDYKDIPRKTSIKTEQPAFEPPPEEIVSFLL